MVYPIWRVILWSWYKIWVRKIEGLNNIPKNVPFIIALNHSSYFDIALSHGIIALKLNKKIHPLVNGRYWKNPIAAAILDHGECIPVYVGKEKSSKRKNEKALQKALEYLKKGELIKIFPEGARSCDGKLQKGKTGIARLALAARVPVLPIGIVGTDKILPKGKIFPRFTRCEVKIGKPLYFDEYYDKIPGKRVFENVTRDVMKEIAKLICQEYNH